MTGPSLDGGAAAGGTAPVGTQRAVDLMPVDPDASQLLQRRAELLAQQRVFEHGVAGSRVHLLHIRLTGGTALAIPFDNLVEVLPSPGVTRVPGAPDHVLGIINFSGTLVTVLDLAAVLRLQDRRGAGAAMVVVTGGGHCAAFPVAELVGSLDRAPDQSVSPPHSHAARRGFLAGVVDGDVGVLNIDRILGDQELLVDQ